MTILFLLLLSLGAHSDTVPLNDNILFAFEKCKTLSVDLNKGQLKEEVAPSFDMHCRKIAPLSLELSCDFFENSSSRKMESTKFTGGSDLGVGVLRDGGSRKISFLIGKKFASFESDVDKKVCVGIFIFEKDALKKKLSL